MSNLIKHIKFLLFFLFWIIVDNYFRYKCLMILISISLSKLCHIVQNRLDLLEWSIILDVISTAQRMQNQSSSIEQSCVCFDIIFVKNISFSLNSSTKVFIISMFHLLCQYIIFEKTLYLFTSTFSKYCIKIFIVQNILSSII